MLKRFGVVLAWLLAALGTASLTYAAVSQAGRAVGDDPAMPVSASDIAARVSTTITAASDTVTALDGATSTTEPGAATTVVVPTGPGTTAPGSATTMTTAPTTTTSASASTTTTSATTTTAAAHTEWKTVSGVGVVGVSVAGDQVTLVSASPVDPYHAEVEENGPERVEVKFESESAEYRVRAEVRDGQLVWEVSSSSGDDDGPEG